MSRPVYIWALPQSTGEVFAIARALISRYNEGPDAPNLLAMILATNHVVDWYLRRDISIEDRPGSIAPLREAYPDWEIIRKCANAWKHPLTVGETEFGGVVHSNVEDVSWGHPHFWGGVHGTRGEYGFEDAGTLCARFLDAFETDIGSGKVRRLVS